MPQYVFFVIVIWAQFRIGKVAVKIFNFWYRIVIHCTIRLNVCHSELFLPNLWKCRYHVYWNLSYSLSILKVIFSKSHNFDQRNQGRIVLWWNWKKMARSTGVRNPPKLLLTKRTFDVFILISVKWNPSSHILYFIYMQRLAIEFVEMHCTRTHIRFFFIYWSTSG